MVFYAFKGKDFHGGGKPTANPVTAERWLQETGLGALSESVGIQNRVGMVIYPNDAAIARSTSILISRLTGFGNIGSQAHFNRGYPTFADEGLRIFGDIGTHQNFLARELVYNAWNTAILSGIRSPIHPSVMLASMTYVDEAGKTCHMKPLSYDPVDDRAMVRRMRGCYSWYVQEICDQHLIPITKTAYASVQRSLLETYKLSLETSRPRLAPINVRLPIKPRLAITKDRLSMTPVSARSAPLVPSTLSVEPYPIRSTCSSPLSTPPMSMVELDFENPQERFEALSNNTISRSKRKALSPLTEESDSSQDGSGDDDETDYEIESIQQMDWRDVSSVI